MDDGTFGSLAVVYLGPLGDPPLLRVLYRAEMSRNFTSQAQTWLTTQ